MVRIVGFDHLVLVSVDVERSVAWYRDALGLEVLRLDDWREGRAPFPSVRIDAGTIIDIIPGAPPAGGGNVDHLCLVCEETDLVGVRDSGMFEVVEGPVSRWGARGVGTSLYVRDPDGNLVELRHYGAGGGAPAAAGAGT